MSHDFLMFFMGWLTSLVYNDMLKPAAISFYRTMKNRTSIHAVCPTCGFSVSHYDSRGNSSLVEEIMTEHKQIAHPQPFTRRTTDGS